MARFPSAVPALALVVYLAAVALALRHATPAMRRALLVFLLFAIANYAIIAAGRANLSALWAPDSGTFAAGSVHRYHYVGSALFVVASSLIATSLLGRSRLRSGETALLALGVGTLLGAQALAPWQIDHRWGARLETARVLHTIRAAVHAAPRGGDVRLEPRPFESVGRLVTPAMFPGWAAVFSIFFPHDRVHGRRVSFVTSDPEVLAAARDGRRSATLLVRGP